MTSVTVNGRRTEVSVPPRTHLADFLRETLRLTGTHLGCEHGVCGACTLLLDGEPARACLAFPALLDGADIRTIEGLADDEVTARLREAFAAEHALQCGYCTPGMLVTARDIVRRLPEADDAGIRLELAGNLCRCTGYDGIVRAIRRVLDERLDLPRTPPAPIAVAVFEAAAAAAPPSPAAAVQPGLSQRLTFAVSADRLWTALRDPARVAACIPGATIDAIDGDRLAGTMQTSLGPIRVRFAGEARLAYDDAARAGTIEGSGAERGGSRLGATVRFRVEPAGETGAVLFVDAEYALRGALAQLARAGVVDRIAGAIAFQFAEALGADLAGSGAPSPVRLRLLPLLWRSLLTWLTRR